MSNVITAQNLGKSFISGKEKTNVLENINLEVKAGEVIALMGESGRGKSTLLQILGGIQDYDAGSVNILGSELGKLSDRKKSELRLKSIGFVYQYHHLLSDFSALENAMLPQLLLGTGKTQAKNHATAMLERLGLGDKLNNRPAELSGGQQQRVAIARALANNPQIIFADEPTGNLDQANTGIVLDLFLKVAKENNTTLVIATHSEIISHKTERIFTL